MEEILVHIVLSWGNFLSNTVLIIKFDSAFDFHSQAGLEATLSRISTTKQLVHNFPSQILLDLRNAHNNFQVNEDNNDIKSLHIITLHYLFPIERIYDFVS